MLLMKWLSGKKILAILMSVFLLGNANAQNNTDTGCPGRLRVKFNEAGLPRQLDGNGPYTGNWTMVYQGKKIRVYRMERVFPYNARTEARTRYAGLHLWYDIWYEEISEVTKSVVRQVVNLPDIQYAEPVYVTRPASCETVWKGIPLANLKPNDTYWNNAWNLNGEMAGSGRTKFADINVQEAWSVTTGRPEVIVAVMDTGIDYDHEDLEGNIWINEDERMDDSDNDGNGYIDDVYGVNFVGKKVDEEGPWKGLITKGWHGTHVAGIIAARTNNSKGVCGIAGGWGEQPGVKLMCCQILGESLNVSDSPAAFKYAADNGAVISSNSWEIDGSPTSMSKVLQEGIDYFIKYAGTDPDDPTGNTQASGAPMKGGIVIFSAGNSNRSMNCWPAMYDKVLAVSNVDEHLKKASNSNYGDWVAFAAPGSGIKSTFYGEVGYYSSSGTSMACPHVSGVAALVVSKFGGPGFTAEQLKEKLLAATHNIDAYNPDYIGQLGRFIDAGMAVTLDRRKAPLQVSDLAVADVSDKEIILSWKLTTDEDDSYVERCRVYYSESPLTATNLEEAEYVENNTREQSIGTTITQTLKLRSGVAYYFGVVEYDRWGNSSLLSNIIRGSLSFADGFLVGQREVYLKWLASAVGNSWVIKWKAKNETEFHSLKVNKTSYNLSLLQPDCEYEVQVLEGESQVILQKTFKTEALNGEFSSIRMPVGELVAGDLFWPVVNNIQSTPQCIVWKVDEKVVDASQCLVFETGKHELRAEVTTEEGVIEVLLREIMVQPK